MTAFNNFHGIQLTAGRYAGGHTVSILASALFHASPKSLTTTIILFAVLDLIMAELFHTLNRITFHHSPFGNYSLILRMCLMGRFDALVIMCTLHNVIDLFVSFWKQATSPTFVWLTTTFLTAGFQDGLAGRIVQACLQLSFAVLLNTILRILQFLKAKRASFFDFKGLGGENQGTETDQQLHNSIYCDHTFSPICNRVKNTIHFNNANKFIASLTTLINFIPTFLLI